MGGYFDLPFEEQITNLVKPPNGTVFDQTKNRDTTRFQTVDKAVLAIMQKPLFCSIETVQRRISLMNIKNM
jgi:hypothetical protein